MMDVLPGGRHGAPRRPMPRKAAVVAMTTAVVMAAGGVGYAAWSVSAAGSSAAKSGAPVQGLVSVATPADALYPGGSTPLYFTVSNPNAFPVTYTSAAFGAVSSDDATGCSPADYITTTNQTINVTVAAGATSTVVSPAGAIGMRSSAPDTCQNRTFTVSTTVTGLSG